MRIAVLTNAYPPMKGGASRIAELQVQMLEAAGHEVRVFQPDTGWFKYPAPIRVFLHVLDLFSNREFVDKIIGWHPEVLLTHNLTGCGFGTPSAIQSERTRWIHVLHDVQLFQPDGRLRDPQPITQWQKLWGGLRGRFLGKPDLVISPTGWLIEQHLRRGLFSDARAEVLPNPAPAISFALRSPSQPLKLFYLGHTRQKGTELLATIFSKLENVFLHAIEPSADMNALAKRFPERVRLSGYIPNEEVVAAMREADVMVFPSQIMENQPTVLLEAMSVGLPVVASDVGGVRETLKGAGLVVQPDDVDAWVLAINRLRDPDEYREQTTMMYERAKEYDAVAYSKKLLQLVSSRP